jgi:two-component system response regulator RpfG
MKIPEYLRLVHSSEQTVLVVDDDEAFLMIMDNLLRQVGNPLAVRAFTNPVRALDWAGDAVADLVVIDCLMPEMNGIDFLRKIRGLPGYASVPTVMVTVAEERAIRYEALKAGVTDFLQKPVDLFECFARCKNLLTLRMQYRGVA